MTSQGDEDQNGNGYHQPKFNIGDKDFVSSPNGELQHPETAQVTKVLSSSNGEFQSPPKTIWTIQELLSADFPEPEWIVPGLIPVGLTALGGRPKLGKSMMALQLAIAKAGGGCFLGQSLKPGAVLYLALEDNPLRLKNRIVKMGPVDNIPITFHLSWNYLPNGGLDDLQAEINKNHYSLIIIDTISRLLGRLDQMDQGEMNELFGKLQSVAINNDIGLLLIDHHRKPSGFEKDPIDDLFGSTGKSATIDTALGLYRERGKHGAILKVVGREVEEQEYTIQRDPQILCWQLIGNVNDVRENSFKGQVIQSIRDITEKGNPATTTSIARHMETDAGHVNRALAEFVADGKVRKGVKDGKDQPYELI